jgi:glycosyltransferase involved in cell wall biosynthesis
MAQRPSLHPLHVLWRALPAGARRAAFTRMTALLAPTPDRHPLAAQAGIVVGGEISRASGLGESARLMAAGLGQVGVACWPIEAGVLPYGENRRAAITGLPEAAPLVLHVNAPMLPAALLRLGRKTVSRRRIIGYWAWELPVVPRDWHAGARMVHEIWAPSRMTAAALEVLCPGRVRVVPHPVAACPPRPSGLGRADFGLPEQALVVLVSFSLASSFVRKAPMAAIAAFRLAFGNRKDCVLVLKVQDSTHAPGDMALIHGAIAGCANIRLELRSLPRDDNHALTACADIVLSLHRSEGFGLVLAEAMLLGRCVVATGWSATSEFLDEGCGVPVPFTLVPATDPRGVYQAPGAVWAEPDIAAAADILRALAADPARRAALGAAAVRAANERLGLGGLRDAVQALGLHVTA